MSSSSFPYVLIPLMVLLFLHITTLVDGKVTVVINNNLPSHQDLKVHCKSKDDDIGERLLHPGNTYQIRFRPTIWPWEETLFFCSFQWSGKLKYFNVYDEVRDKCNLCNWNLREIGPCLQGGDCYLWHEK